MLSVISRIKTFQYLPVAENAGAVVGKQVCFTQAKEVKMCQVFVCIKVFPMLVLKQAVYIQVAHL